MLRSRLLRTGIVLLCLWHMAAIALFAVPANALPMVGPARRALLPAVQWYAFSLSQWQRWNLFSPDPLRRVTTYRVDRLRDGRWELLQRFAPGSFARYRHAAWFKYFTNLLDDDAEDAVPVQERFLVYLCMHLALRPQTALRLTLERRVLPHHDRIADNAWWSGAAIPTTDVTVARVSCPSDADRPLP